MIDNLLLKHTLIADSDRSSDSVMDVWTATGIQIVLKQNSEMIIFAETECSWYSIVMRAGILPLPVRRKKAHHTDARWK